MRPTYPVILLLGSVLLLRPAGLSGQGGNVTGVVTAAGSGAPIVSAVVQLSNAAGGRVSESLTSGSGRYLLSNIPPGTYSLTVSATGFATGRAVGIDVAGDQTFVADFALQGQVVDLDPLVVSVSRNAERALDAPARTEVITSQEIEVRPTITTADHLRGVPGVDIATSGVQSTNVVARGFNNVFSGSLYMLSDHRIAGVPSLRVNLMHFIPITNEDIERMEVVLGPGSALYGPGTANGVVHILTRSPLTSPGTSLSITGGERSLFHGVLRTAHRLSDNFGVKLSGQYLQADEWEYTDRVEAREKAKFENNLAFWRQDLMNAAGISQQEADMRIARIGNRDFDVQRWSAEARADWRVTPELTTVLSVGTSMSNGIELTGLGAGQAVDWRSDFYQIRANWRRAFAQAYLNRSDAGDTYLLRNGAPITDRSSLLVAQIQNGTGLWGGRQDFVYGLDLLRTTPDTKGTINGAYEDEDNTTEFGGYIQSTTALTPTIDLVLAGRIDSHSALPDPIFSPRAAVVFSPTDNHSFRATFNRAFSTPTSLTQFLDLGTASPIEAAAQLGYSVRVQGTGQDGFSFARQDGSYLIRSPFTAAIGQPTSTLLPAAQAREFWPAAVQVVAAGAPTPLPAQLVSYLQGLSGATLGLSYAAASADAEPFPLDNLSLQRIEPIREETSTTFELGYKGILGNTLLLAADFWWSRRENLVTPLTVATPFIHFDSESTRQYLAQALVPFFQGAGSPDPAAAAAATAAQLAPGFARVPLGVISSQDVNANGPQILVTYFNVDEDLELYGTDLSATALITPTLSVEGTLSLVSDDIFETSRGTRVTLNAPKRKGSLAALYSGPSGLNAEARIRYTAGFPVVSGVYEGTACLGDEGEDVEPCVEAATLFDVNLGYPIPGVSGATVQLAIQNLFDEGYRSFPGVPNVGRMALLRIRYNLR